MVILFIVYVIAGFWATGKTIYADKIIIEHRFGDFFVQRVIWGTVAGFVLIPWAILKCIFGRK